MKNLLLFVSLTLFTLLIFSCNSQKKADEVAGYQFKEKSTEIDPELIKNIGEWLEEDVKCYGLIVSINNKGMPLKGKSVKAKVVEIDGKEIKMKALEKISLKAEKNGSKKGILRGETWIERDMELFQSREEADNYLKSKNLLVE